MISPETTHLDSPREQVLARILSGVRELLPVDSVSVVTRGAAPGSVARAASWSAPDIRPDELELGALSREALDGGHSCASGALAACPIRDDDGEAIGALAVTARGAAVEPAQVRALESLADLAAMALDRGDLLAADQRRKHMELELGRATEAVAQSLELEEVYGHIVRHAAALTGAGRALLTRINSRTAELRTEARVDFTDAQVDRLLVLSADSFGRVARTRTPLLRRSAGHEGQGRELLEREGIATLMHAPIELGPRLYGVLTVVHDQGGQFGEHELELLMELARASAGAIANAIDFQRERRIARALTLGFVPESLPRLAGYETGLLYAPAENEPTGGDVYGAWPLGDDGDAIAVLVGDVAGKGVETAALSSMVRFFVEARSWDSRSPAAVLEQTSRMLQGRLPADTFVTAFFGIVAEGSLRYANAGHLPPLLISGDDVLPLTGRGLPLGVGEPGSYMESELALGAGELVFAYTDGLVEARREGELYGVERLTRLVTGWSRSLPPEELVRAVHEEVAGWAGGLADDAVALALRRPA